MDVMRPKPTERPAFPALPRLLACTILIVGIGLFTVVSCLSVRGRLATQADNRFAALTDTYVHQLTQRLERYGDVLYATRGLDIMSDIQASSWQDFVKAQYTFERHPGVQAIAYAATVPQTEKAAYIARMQRELPDANFTVHPEKSDGDYVLVTYAVEDDPAHQEHNAALGFDLASEPSRRAALEQAILNNKVAATAPITLSTTQKLGFLLVLPLEVEHGLQGYSVAAFDTATLVEMTFRSLADQYGGNVTLRDTTASPIPMMTYGLGTEEATLNRDVTIQVADRTWQLSFQMPVRSLQTTAVRMLPFALLAGGSVLMFTVAILFYSMGMRKELKRRSTSPS